MNSSPYRDSLFSVDSLFTEHYSMGTAVIDPIHPSQSGRPTEAQKSRESQGIPIALQQLQRI